MLTAEFPNKIGQQLVGSSDPKPSDPSREVDHQSAAGEDVATDDDLMGRLEGRQSGDLEFEIKPEIGDRKADSKVDDRNWFASCFAKSPPSDGLERKPFRELITDTGLLRSGVELGKRVDRRDPLLGWAASLTASEGPCLRMSSGVWRSLIWAQAGFSLFAIAVVRSRLLPRLLHYHTNPRRNRRDDHRR